MLLVKSKESKNSNSYRIGDWLWMLMSIAATTPFLVSAQATEPTAVTSSGQWITVFLSLLLVVAVIFMLGFIVRRFTPMHGSTGQMKSVASMMVGTRERIAVIQVGDEQHLVGITSQNINHLAKLETPITAPSQEPSERFKERLAGLMKIQNREK